MRQNGRDCDKITTSYDVPTGEVGMPNTDNLYYLTPVDSQHSPCWGFIGVCFWRASP